MGNDKASLPRFPKVLDIRPEPQLDVDWLVGDFTGRARPMCLVHHIVV